MSKFSLNTIVCLKMNSNKMYAKNFNFIAINYYVNSKMYSQYNKITVFFFLDI